MRALFYADGASRYDPCSPDTCRLNAWQAGFVSQMRSASVVLTTSSCTEETVSIGTQHNAAGLQGHMRCKALQQLAQ